MSCGRQKLGPGPRAAAQRVPNRWNLEPGWNESQQALCNLTRPRPARRSQNAIKQHGQRCVKSRQWHALQRLVCATLLLVSSGCRCVYADYIYVAQPLEERTDLLFDRGNPPEPPMRLYARQEPTSTFPTSISAPTSNGSALSSSSSPSPVASSINTAAPTSSSPLPSPFDSSLGNNFTAPSCPAFFESFLSNTTFQKCRPFSLLLQTSNGFFTASHSLVELSQTLAASCNVDYAACSAIMASLAQQIQLQSNCGADLHLQNPQVQQAYNGLIAYPTLYHAGCLTDTGGNYCFADAVTNASAPTSSYIYYLPLGVQLPAGTKPTCNSCLQNTMAIFASAASNNSQPLSSDYMSAAQQVDISCGPTFVQASVQSTSAAPGRASIFNLTAMLTLAFLLVVVLA